MPNILPDMEHCSVI